MCVCTCACELCVCVCMCVWNAKIQMVEKLLLNLSQMQLNEVYVIDSLLENGTPKYMPTPCAEHCSPPLPHLTTS